MIHEPNVWVKQSQTVIDHSLGAHARLSNLPRLVYLLAPAAGDSETSLAQDPDIDDSTEPAQLEVVAPIAKAAATGKKPELPIFSILDKIDFSDHFVIIGDVGTGKSTVTPIHEFELSGDRKSVV
jgi:hypothetical protein